MDHIALTVPDLDGLIERLAGAFGMVAEARSEYFALIAPVGLAGLATAGARRLGEHGLGDRGLAEQGGENGG